MRQSRVKVSCKSDSSLSTIIYHSNGSSFLLSQNDEHCGHCEGCEARKSVFICNAAKRFVDLSVTKSESVTLWKRWGRLFSHQFHFFWLLKSRHHCCFLLNWNLIRKQCKSYQVFLYIPKVSSYLVDCNLRYLAINWTECLQCEETNSPQHLKLVRSQLELLP